MDIQTQGRAVLTAVGNRETFESNVLSYSGTQAQAELMLAQMVAFAYSSYWKGGENKAEPITFIRETVRLAKDPARRLGKALTRITKTSIPADTAPAKAALHFANEFVADFYNHETKARIARKEKAKAKQVEKLQAEAEVLEYTLVGAEGVVDALTEGEWMALRIYLNEMRTEQATAKAA